MKTLARKLLDTRLLWHPGQLGAHWTQQGLFNKSDGPAFEMELDEYEMRSEEGFMKIARVSVPDECFELQVRWSNGNRVLITNPRLAGWKDRSL